MNAPVLGCCASKTWLKATPQGGDVSTPAASNETRRHNTRQCNAAVKPRPRHDAGRPRGIWRSWPATSCSSGARREARGAGPPLTPLLHPEYVDALAEV